MALTLSASPYDSALLTQAGDKIQTQDGQFLVINSGYATIGAKGQVFYEFKRRDFEVT
ncbi:hypothetical protein LCGC14_2026230, partial [marine sediment metagenome]